MNTPSESDLTPLPRPSAGTLLQRAARLRCPRCGEGRLFSGFVRMPETCSHCDFKYERAPGYFLGSAYINYGITALSITVLFMLARFRGGWRSEQIAIPLAVLALLLPLILFRHARAMWMALDCFFDSNVLDDEQQ